MADKSESVIPSASQPSLLRSSLVTLGIPVPVMITAVDSLALWLCHVDKHGWKTYAAYGLFVVQTTLLGALVGSQVKRQRLWWGILLWGIVLMDLQVFTLAAGDYWSPAHTLGIAFASSQAGVLICLAVLGTTAGSVRLPSAAIGLAFVGFFAFTLEANDDWYTVLFFQGIATATVCLVLRIFGFRIERLDYLPSADHADQRMQFSIRHIFYWTTGVAVTLALVRLIGWQTLWSWARGTEVGPDLLIVAPLLTVVGILGMWGALGRESWIARTMVLCLMLPGIGAIAGGAAGRWTGRWLANRLFADWYTNRGVETGIVWAVLAGALLAGLLLVFRTSGSRLQRRTTNGERHISHDSLS